MAKPVGWRKQPARHSLAAKGIKTNTDRQPTYVNPLKQSTRIMWARYADVIDVSGDQDDPYLQSDVSSERSDEIEAMGQKVRLKIPKGEWTFSPYDEYLNGIQEVENDLKEVVRSFEERAKLSDWDKDYYKTRGVLPGEINTWLNLNDQQIDDSHPEQIQHGPDLHRFYLLGYHDGQELMGKRFKRSGL